MRRAPRRSPTKFPDGLNIAVRGSDGSPVTTPAVALRAACPACGAATRLGDPWCTLCYADLTPAQAPADAVPRPTDPGIAAVQPFAAAGGDLLVPAGDGFGGVLQDATPDPTTDPAGGPADEPSGEAGTSPLDAVTMPCPACDTRVRLLVSNCPVCGTDMLASLRGPDPSHRNRFVRELMSMSRAARMSMAGVIAVLLLVTIFSVSSILG